MYKVVVKKGVQSPHRRVMHKKGLICPLDIIKLFDGDTLIVKGRVKDLIIDCPDILIKILWAVKDFRIDSRQFSALTLELQKRFPELAKMDKRRRALFKTAREKSSPIR